MLIENRRDEGVRIYGDICPTMRAAWGTGGGNVPMIVDDEIYSMANCDHTLTLYGVNVAPTITSRCGTGGNQVPVFVEKEIIGVAPYNSTVTGDVTMTLSTGSEQNANKGPCVIECAKGIISEKANTLRANAGAIKHMADLKGRTVVEDSLTPWDVQSNRIVSDNGKAATLYGGAGQGTHNGAVMQSAYSFDSMASNSMKSKNPNSGCREVDVAKTVDTSDPNPSKNQGGIAIIDSYAVAQNQRGELRIDTDKAYALTATEGSRPGQSKPCVVEGINYQGNKGASNTFTNICPTLEATHGHDVHVIKQDNYCIAGNTIDRKIENGGNGAGFQKDVSYTLNTIDRHAVNTVIASIGHDERSSKFDSDVADPLTATDYKDPERECVCRDISPDVVGSLAAADGKGKNGQDINKFPVVESRIRRLTPTECERLQGLPDDWTNVPSVDRYGKEKPASDANRYKAIGNGMA